MTGCSRQVSARRVRRICAFALATGRPRRRAPEPRCWRRCRMRSFSTCPWARRKRAPRTSSGWRSAPNPGAARSCSPRPRPRALPPRATVTAPAILGRLAAALSSRLRGTAGSIFGVVEVQLFDGELTSVSRVQMLNGANAAAIRSVTGAWEVIQFQTAEEIAPSLWQLNGLLRGQLGTGDAMEAGAAEGCGLRAARRGGWPGRTAIIRDGAGAQLARGSFGR